jgi:hypothetical protein
MRGKPWFSRAPLALGRRGKSSAEARKHRVRLPEHLEAKHLLDGFGLAITEFLSSSSSGLADEDGEFSDWIEVQNVSAEPLNLAGYGLTDSVSEPGKWRFPEVELGAGEFLVVFASGKDRTTNPSSLHTNFRLAEDGEYLALVAPSGEKLQEFNPAFPQQRTGVSYGQPQSAATDTFVSPTSQGIALVPTSGALGDSWTELEFGSRGWRTVASSIGYDQGPNYDGPIESDLEDLMFDKNGTAYLRVPFDVNDPGSYDFLNLDLQYDDGFIAYLNGTEVARRNAPAGAAWNSVATADHGGVFDSVDFPSFNAGSLSILGSSQFADGRLRLTTAATEQRGAAWTSNPVQFGSSYSFSTEFAFEVKTPGGPTDNLDGPGGEGFALTIQSNGTSVLGNVASSFALQGGATPATQFVSIEFDSRPGGNWDTGRAPGSHVAVNTHLSATSIGQAGRAPRFNDGGVYHAWIDYDGATRQMRIYLSETTEKPAEPLTTTVVDLSQLFGGQRDLTVGFSAATGVATNVHEIVSWNFATGDSELGLSNERINLSEHLGLLREGENVLAIHGLNVAANDRDFFLRPTLSATNLDAPLEHFQYFSAPTPGRSNGEGFDGLTRDPSFSIPAGVYGDRVNVELASATPDARIYYTLNNTAPTTASTLYTGAISTDSSTIVRAIAVRDGFLNSEISVSRYTVLAQDVQDVSSNLPLVILDTYTRSPNESTYTEVGATVIDVGVDGRATLAGEADYNGRAAFKLRGSSSIGFPKQQYGFEIWDEAGADQSVPLLGMPQESDWVLYAPYSEKSLMQNALAYDWSREMGQYAPRVRFVELYMNITGSVSSADYRGVYILMERIKRDPARVDIAELTPESNAEPDVTGGYILKKDRLDPGDTGFSTSRGQTLGFVEPKEDEITPTQRAYITGYMNAFETALYGANFADPVNGYAKFIDIDSFIDHHIMVEMTKNIDGFRLSTFMYKDRGGKLVMGPIWDYNLSMGNANYLNGDVPSGWYYDQLGDGDYPWYRRLFQDPAFQQRYTDRWTELRRDIFSTDSLMADVDAYAELLDEAQARNFQKWPILGVYVWPNPNGYGERNTYQKEVDFLKNFMRNRTAWIDSNWPYAPGFSHPGGEVPEGFELDLLSAGSPIYYTTDGSDPRLPTGGVNPTAIRVEPSDGRAVVPIGAPVKYFVPTSNALGATWRELEFDDSGWKDGTTGIGFDGDGSMSGHYSTDVSADMLGVNASVYVRLPVDVVDPAALTNLRLKLKYDDGFIAYLNGVELFVRNVTPRGRSYNGAASADRNDAQATAFEIIDLSPYVDLLVPGRNVFSFQAMNNNAAQNDFLFTPEIVEITGKAATLILDRNVVLHARSYNGVNWSGLSEATFVVGDGLSLRVSELMYNPAPGPVGGFESSEYEFIELQNTGSQPISLAGAKFTLGVTMDLPAVTLQPGTRGVAVANRAAFESRYGLEHPVLGEFTGRLSNAGEQVTLAGSLGETILTFSYDDGWHPLTDGGGYSLVVRNPQAAKYTWNQANAWRASFVPGGTPGTDDKLPGDANQDGKVDLEDLNLVRSNFGESGEGDVNGDGVVDLSDLNEVRNAIGQSNLQAPGVAPSPARPYLPQRDESKSNITSLKRPKQRGLERGVWDDALLELIESGWRQY